MNLENIKSTTTWAEASGTMNNNNAKITEAIERLESAVEEGGGGGTADSVAWNKVTGKPSWITDSKPVYAKEDLSQGVQTSLDKADTALQAIPDGYATEEYTREQVRHILNLMSTALEGKVDKVDGKQLSTEDFTTELKEKLEALSSSGGGDVDSEALQELSDRLDLIVSGGASGVIDSFADIVAFLTGINDSVKLKDMLDTLRESILRKQNTIEDLDAIRSGAALGATAVQRGESVASAVFATSAGSAVLLQGVSKPTDFSGTDLNVSMRLYGELQSGTDGLFPHSYNANAVLTINKYQGNFNSQLGFSSNGKLYYRNGGAEVLTTQPWKQIAFTDTKVDSATSADDASFLVGRKYPGTTLESVADSKVRYDYAITSSSTAMFPNKNNANSMLTFNRYPGKFYSQLGLSSDGNLYYRINKSDYDISANDVWKQLAFVDTKVDVAVSADSASKLATARSIFGNQFDGTQDINRIKSDSGKTVLVYTDNVMGIGGGYFGDSDYVYIDGKHIYMRASDTTDFFINSDGHVNVTKNLKVSGNVGIGTTEPAYKLEVVSGHYSVAMLESLQYPESSIVYKGNDKKSWAVGKGTGVTGDSFGFWSETKGGNVMLMRADGCVGIGTNDPRHELDILNNGEGLRLLSRNDKSVMLIQNVGGMNWEVGAMNNNIFAIRSTVWGGNVIVCNHSGDVGIGTSTLSARLNVGGSANVTENISVGGNATISGTSTLRDARITEAVAIRMGVGTTISEDYALSVGGDVSVSGYVMTEGVSMYSQRSLKDVVDEEGLSLEELAAIKPTRFTWKDGRDEKVHIGGIADDVQKVLPEAVRETPEGILTMDYPVASFAVASSLVKPVTDHEERIAELERENKRLREELEMIKRYIGYGNDK